MGFHVVFMDNTWAHDMGFYCSFSEAQIGANDRGQIKALLGGMPVRDGKKISPSLLSMPPWLKNLYICELQEMHRLRRKLNDEVNRLLAKENYVTKI